MLLVTGGAGFIGANFVLSALAVWGEPMVTLDKLTYAGNPRNLDSLRGDARHALVRGDIGDRLLVRKLLTEHRPRAIVHFAAESHVDRSIEGPGEFITTNVVGTFALLEEVRAYWSASSADERDAFRFLHVSTDEVYGSLGPAGAFTETTRYDPHSPYSASKAASDHLARAWFDTYGLPVIVTNCSNNYGPYQFPEKLIPVVILKCLRGEPIPVYGKGENIRDWLYVEDHCEALSLVIQKGQLGETYNIGGNNEKRNIDLVHLLCEILDELSPRASTLESGAGGQGHAPIATRYSELITYVTDRPGHDMRYAIDASKIKRELGWTPKQDHASGFRKTVQWYLDNDAWCQEILSGTYKLERQGTL